jgi:hypothetical protein
VPADDGVEGVGLPVAERGEEFPVIRFDRHFEHPSI